MSMEHQGNRMLAYASQQHSRRRQLLLATPGQSHSQALTFAGLLPLFRRLDGCDEDWNDTFPGQSAAQALRHMDLGLQIAVFTGASYVR
jgi:hypothetical protein